MANKWVEFVRKWAARENMNYMCAMTNEKCKAQYRQEHPKIPAKQMKKRDTAQTGLAEMGKKAIKVVAHREANKKHYEKKTAAKLPKERTKKRKLKAGTLKALKKSGYQDYEDSRGEEVNYDNETLLDFLQDWLAGGDGSGKISDPEERKAIINDWTE